jgi:hypothetical protein
MTRAATAPPTPRVRAGVGSALRNAGLPYGYTITVWSTAQATIAAHGTPSVGFIALFALGAITAYWALRVATSGATAESDEHPAAPVALHGWLIQATAVGVPVGAMALLAKALPSGLCWPLAGVVTVAGYLGVMGLGLALSPSDDD